MTDKNEEKPFILKSEWVKLCHKDELIEGKGVDFEDETYITNNDSQAIALFKHSNKIYAIDSRCIHQGGDLSIGDIEDVPTTFNDDEIDDPDFFPAVICPVHEWKFSLKSGTSSVSKSLCQETFPVRVNSEGFVEVKLKIKEFVEF